MLVSGHNISKIILPDGTEGIVFVQTDKGLLKGKAGSHINNFKLAKDRDIANLLKQRKISIE